MNRNFLLIGVIGVMLAAPRASAQFLGDALAAAGLAVAEADGAEIIVAAAGGINDPALTTASSSAPQTMTVYTPDTAGTNVGANRAPTPAGSTASVPATSSSGSSGTSSSSGSGGASPASGTTGSAPVSGSATGISGVAAHQAAIDPKAAAAWHDAFRPVGTKMAKPPAGAITIEFGGVSYAYSKGMFLRQTDGSWQVVAAPVGAAIGEKPVGAATVFSGSKPYTYYAGTFYVYDGGMRAYVVVAPPVGTTVSYLPESAAKVQWSGSTHYAYAGTYYKPFYRGSSLVYTVAGS